ncbi:hypothetical protein MAPG_06893, partial [Magnaporthiopsis poae ATCC 64411]
CLSLSLSFSSFFGLEILAPRATKKASLAHIGPQAQANGPLPRPFNQGSGRLTMPGRAIWPGHAYQIASQHGVHRLSLLSFFTKGWLEWTALQSKRDPLCRVPHTPYAAPCALTPPLPSWNSSGHGGPEKGKTRLQFFPAWMLLLQDSGLSTKKSCFLKWTHHVGSAHCQHRQKQNQQRNERTSLPRPSRKKKAPSGQRPRRK